MIKNTKISIRIKNLNYLAARHSLSIILLISLTSLLGACQLSPPPPPVSIEKKVMLPVKYSQYYLWLKTLNNEQIQAEEIKQESILKNKFDDKTHNVRTSKDKNNAHGKLILIYSLPKPQFNSPYKAKRLLNELLLSSDKISKDNLAFSMLLRDQLNAQLYLIQNQEKLTKSFNTRAAENDKKIEELTQQLSLVNQQLLLLKQIEQNINERG